MSRSTLLQVYKSKATWDVELVNSYGTGSVLWQFLWETYLQAEGPYPFFDDAKLKKLWRLYKNPEVPLPLRVAHFFTFDRTVWLSKYILKAAPLVREAADIISRYCTVKSYANHWPAIADYFEKVGKKHDARMIGIALNCTSVADVWDDYGRNGDRLIKATSDDFWAETPHHENKDSQPQDLEESR